MLYQHFSMRGMADAHNEVDIPERCSTSFKQPGTCHLALGPDICSLDGSASGSSHEADLLDQP
jgi:hypothetical protein